MIIDFRNTFFICEGELNCRLSFCMQPIINNIIKINEESPSNNLTIV